MVKKRLYDPKLKGDHSLIPSKDNPDYYRGISISHDNERDIPEWIPVDIEVDEENEDSVEGNENINHDGLKDRRLCFLGGLVLGAILWNFLKKPADKLYNKFKDWTVNLWKKFTGNNLEVAHDTISENNEEAAALSANVAETSNPYQVMTPEDFNQCVADVIQQIYSLKNTVIAKDCTPSEMALEEGRPRKIAGLRLPDEIASQLADMLITGVPMLNSENLNSLLALHNEEFIEENEILRVPLQNIYDRQVENRKAKSA
jgi:hypothetical protein